MRPNVKLWIAVAMFLALPLLAVHPAQAGQAPSVDQFLAQLSGAGDQKIDVNVAPISDLLLGCTCSLGNDSQGDACGCSASGAGASCVSSGQGTSRTCTCKDSDGSITCKLVDGHCRCA